MTAASPILVAPRACAGGGATAAAPDRSALLAGVAPGVDTTLPQSSRGA